MSNNDKANTGARGGGKSPINWFPGHMAKSLRMMDETVPLMDVLVYILDARAPAACINPAFEKYTAKLPVIYVLNKSDLAQKEETDKWKKLLTADRRKAVSLNSNASGSAKSVFSLAKDLCMDTICKKAQKGVKCVLRCMVIGVPNCGKSTFINNLSGKTKAYAENRAGVTRGKQWIRVNDYLEVLDTPGTLYPKIENKDFGNHLAYIGSIRDEILDKHELALSLLGEMMAKNPEFLAKRYALNADVPADEMLEQIAIKRGMLLRGGIPDVEKAAIALIDDFRKGRLGEITLESVDENSGIV